MVIDKIDETLDELKDGLKDIGLNIILPEHVIALLEGLVIDKMSYSDEIDLAAFERETSKEAAVQLKADLARMPSGLRMMICPGGNRSCGYDIVRNLRASATVPAPLRKRMETAIKNWCDAMDAIAQEASEGGVPVVVRYDLTRTGPELALGYGREGHHGVHAHEGAAAEPQATR